MLADATIGRQLGVSGEWPVERAMVKRLGPGNGQRIDAAIPEPRCESPAARRREPPSAGGADVAGGKPLPGPDNGEGEDALAALCTEAAARGGLIPYRDSRFAENWFAMGGRQQTAFFATAVCQALPPALRDDINAHGLSILDLGCATGDALPVLHSYFPASLLAGVDVSPIAVSLARFLHPDFTFYCFDELAKSRLLPDIVYCSNTLEHVETWSGTLARLGAIARQYIVLAVPFGEYACISGHFASFGVDTLPERIGGAAQLVFQVVLDAGGEAEGAWAGRQLIVVYASAAAAERLVRLGWLAARERAAAATAERAAEYGRLLAEQHRLAAEREEANAAALAEARRAAGEARSALARSATDTGAALEAERAAAAARLAEQEQIAAAREAALHTVIAGQADRAALLAREAAEQQVAADMAAAELLWRLAQRGFFAAEREAALRARVKELAALLPRLENRWSSRRRAAIAMRRGARAFARGDWRTAAAAYRRAVDYAPGSAADWAQLGRSLACQGDHAGAAAAFDRAVAIDDSAADVHVELGRALASAGEFCAAIEALEAAGRLQPATEDVEQELAALYGRMVGEGDRARDGRDWAAAAQRYWRALDRA
ncbi:MAG TPA: class I SAM-dependent methyltransferase, partial [Stellaceae bacterium]|nr:class I SAM-dependent methyltransferase [Stellaceae bacterium]